MPNEFIARNGLRAQNNSDITGSFRVSGGITGSLHGTSSYALTASYALNTNTTGSGFPFSGSAVITGSIVAGNTPFSIINNNIRSVPIFFFIYFSLRH